MPNGDITMTNKQFICANLEGFSVVGKFKDFSAKDWATKPQFQIDNRDQFAKFKANAKSVHVGAKLKPTVPAVKKWVRENKPSQYYAKWRMDSELHKDDSVEIFASWD